MSPSASRVASLSAVVSLVASRSLLAAASPTLVVPADDYVVTWREQRRAGAVGSEELSLLSLAAASSAGGAASSWSVNSVYDTPSNCSDAPMMVMADVGCSAGDDEDWGCQESDTIGSSSGDWDIPEVTFTAQCIPDLSAYLSRLFAGATYLRADFFDERNCSDLFTTNVFLVDGECHAQVVRDARSHENAVYAHTATLRADGSMEVSAFNTTDCSGEPMSSYAINATQLETHECADGRKGYTNADSSSSSSGSNGATSLSIGVVASVAVACIAFFAK